MPEMNFSATISRGLRSQIGLLRIDSHTHPCIMYVHTFGCVSLSCSGVMEIGSDN